MKCNTAILILSYNRLNYIKDLVKVIKMLNHSKIYISNDGPKSKGDEKKVFEVRNFLIDSFKDNENVFLDFKTLIKDVSCVMKKQFHGFLKMRKRVLY